MTGEQNDNRVATARTLISDATRRVELYDLFMTEAIRVLSATDGSRLALDVDPFDEHVYVRRIQAIAAEASCLVSILTVLAFFADADHHDRIGVDVIDRLGNRRDPEEGLPLLARLRMLPTLLALYAIGLGSIAARRIRPLARVLATVRVPGDFGHVRLSEWPGKERVIDEALLSIGLETTRHRTPISDLLHDLLVAPASAIYLERDRLDLTFDDLEYVLSLNVASTSQGRGPVGAFLWRRRDPKQPYDAILDDVREDLLAEGLFNGSAELLDGIHDAFDEHVQETRRWWPLR